jgi:lipopolysaccharide export system permease protein
MRSGKLITRLDRYIFRQLALALIAVTGGLTALVWLVQSLRFIELVVNHGLSLGVFIELTGLLIPSFVAVILPITTFVVVQFVYQRLAGDREITVMRAAGLSPLALSRSAIALSVLVVMIGYALNLWIVPHSLASFRKFQWEIRNSMAAFLLQEGVFTQVSENLTVYVRARDPDGTLHGIMVDDGRNKNAHATILAERGRLVEGPNGPRALLLDGSREEIDHQTGRLNVLTFGQNDIDLSDNTSSGGARVPDMSEQPLSRLLNPQMQNPRDVSKWIAEGHKRLSSPFSAMSYAFVGLLSVLTGTFRRHGSFVRPLVAVGTMVVLLAIGFAVQNLAAGDTVWLPLMWLQAIGPGVVCAWLLLGPQLLDQFRYQRAAAA